MMTNNLIFAMKTFTTFIHSLALVATLGFTSTSLADASAETKPAEEAASTAEAPAADDSSSGPASTTNNLIYKMDQQMDLIDEKFALIKKPDSSLKRSIDSRKSRIESSITRIENYTADLAEIQEEFNETNTGAYAFEQETAEDRFKYTNEGQAAYAAMINDLKSNSIARKVMGLNKFEAYSLKFQGIEGYEEAYKIYTTSVTALYQRWTKVLAAEKKKRERYNDAKLEALEKSEALEYERMEKKAEAAGYDIDRNWFNPSLKNVEMLETLISKSSRLVRQFEYAKKDKPKAGVGCTPPLLEAFWQKMDEAREMMITGNLEGAQTFVENDESFNDLLRLSRDVFPEEYCSPLRDEFSKLKTEIRKRATSKRKIEYSLERQTNLLEREVENAQTQIDAIIEEIEKELDLQNESDAENAVQMTEEDRIKASQEADDEASHHDE